MTLIRKCRRSLKGTFITNKRRIPIGLDYSWFVIFALLTWLLAINYYPTEFKNWPPLLYWLMGTVTAVTLFIKRAPP